MDHGIRVSPLGETGIEVTQLCFGVLPIGPAQLNVPADEGAGVVAAALDGGVNFLDTAQSYRTYGHIRPALAARQRPEDVVIASKSAAASYEDMKDAINQARQELGRDQIDVFHLHAARVTPEVFAQRAGALRCLVEAKRAGVIRATGISTHSVTVTRAAAERDDIDVIFPIINRLGLGILHGTLDEMVAAVNYGAARGKGLYAMKVFGGGNLLTDMRSALDFVLAIDGFASIAVGMVRTEEVAMNLAIFSGRMPAPGDGEAEFTQKKLTIMGFCKGCGICVETCPNHALSLVRDKAFLDETKCLLCGYCAPACPEFAIRIV